MLLSGSPFKNPDPIVVIPLAAIGFPNGNLTGNATWVDAVGGSPTAIVVSEEVRVNTTFGLPNANKRTISPLTPGSPGIAMQWEFEQVSTGSPSTMGFSVHMADSTESESIVFEAQYSFSGAYSPTHWAYLLGDAGVGTVAGGITIPASTWTTFRLEFDGSNVRYYLNGTLVNTFTGATAPLSALTWCWLRIYDNTSPYTRPRIRNLQAMSL